MFVFCLDLSPTSLIRDIYIRVMSSSLEVDLCTLTVLTMGFAIVNETWPVLYLSEPFENF